MPIPIPDAHKRIIEKADKFARNKTHQCLLGGCKNSAIRGHAIPRSSCVEALADEKQHIYTTRPSLSSLIHATAIDEPREVVAVGINDASIFKGYCGYHDTKLFAPAEIQNSALKQHMGTALHLRALSIEYCRKRYSCDFLRKVIELSPSQKEKRVFTEILRSFSTAADIFKQHQLDRLIFRDHPFAENVEYNMAIFKGNLQVSCCGCFNQSANSAKSALESIIGYNLISYRDMSVLTLTTFTSGKPYMDSYNNDPNLLSGYEKILNDIAFSRGEEPLIGAKLWKTLTDSEKMEVQLALRHPMHRPGKTELQIIKLTSDNSILNIVPEMLTRLPTDISKNIDEINEAIRNVAVRPKS